VRVERHYRGLVIRAGAARINVETDLDNVPLPRLTVYLSPGYGGDGEHPDELLVAVELSDGGSDPVVSVGVTVPWRRPRPWACEVVLPPRGRWSMNRLIWRRPDAVRS
jgi:hypothetical protein